MGTVAAVAEADLAESTGGDLLELAIGAALLGVEATGGAAGREGECLRRRRLAGGDSSQPP
ncbi:hypothetical protein ACFQ71_31535 [Streptomyces sp. NPDC056534]|uniref:hypothetical protein n=1 Tax=Streptomyces sp. NPDC056534 TaxID=3345857 RepID=UPI0036A12C2E